MNKSFLISIAAIASTLGCTTARAADLQVTVFETIGGLNQQVASWTQDQNPTPLMYVSGTYTTVSISNAMGVSNGDTITWYSNSKDQLGGFTDFDENFNILTQSSYASEESQPVFLPGTYHGVDVKPDFSYLLAYYTISVINKPAATPKFAMFHVETAIAAAAVPEPSSWAMMFAGLGTIGFVLRRRVKAGLANS